MQDETKKLLEQRAEELEYCRNRLVNIIAKCVEGIVIADDEG